MINEKIIVVLSERFKKKKINAHIYQISNDHYNRSNNFAITITL